ncbi:hypothetical protein HME9302_01420 [Alteripontixanthobacter maritimus]|uniref:DUF4139 domain-containing protein n=1 Tax=Alteripontixanthobacter maritimus TaxID=2161824 RepID=A0A369QBC7_9SPHN|nr:hypothetical protein [Alteripontixanthobacter maritimus]RDC60219.1 hypothetical protein HME9302_01420 [Alteripontixanthobacter maritimus]
MRTVASLLAATLLWAIAVVSAAMAQEPARSIVDASEPDGLSVTVYRDPARGPQEEMDLRWPEGFAMISETRTVTLPPGQSRIRFEGVSEGMVAVSAIVTGLPGGTIEKNRNADLLSPGALVDGTLGNRVRITRTDPATGIEQSQRAIIRTRADGGLVVETDEGFEAVRCSGLPERLSFDRVPEGLSAKPVFSIDTQDPAGGTYTVTLTYLSWGFDWQAHYVGTILETRPAPKGGSPEMVLDLLSWLTILNDNGQSFANADLLAVAGTLNVESDFEELADAPEATPLRLLCYPIGSTARGSPMPRMERSGRTFNSPAPMMAPPPPPPPAPVSATSDQKIVVTGSRISQATQEDLGDLKLYRVPQPVTVSSKGLKQVAFLDKEAVIARQIYRTICEPWNEKSGLVGAGRLLVTKNEEAMGLGVAMPSGGFTLFEPGPYGDQLVAEQGLRDFAVGQDIELPVGDSSAVFASCSNAGRGTPDDNGRKWTRMEAKVSNANPHPVTMRFVLGASSQWSVRGLRKVEINDGMRIYETAVPAKTSRTFKWKIRRTDFD